MKVYFDDDSRLRHHGCDGYVLAQAVLDIVDAPILNNDDDWRFPTFDATVDLGDAPESGWNLVAMSCDKCGKRVSDLVMWETVELLPEDEIQERNEK